MGVSPGAGGCLSPRSVSFLLSGLCSFPGPWLSVPVCRRSQPCLRCPRRFRQLPCFALCSSAGVAGPRGVQTIQATKTFLESSEIFLLTPDSLFWEAEAVSVRRGAVGGGGGKLKGAALQLHEMKQQQ